MRVVIWVLLIVFVLLLVGNMLSGDSSNKGSTYSTRGTASPIIACYRRGVAYFKEIGSYPTLSDGRAAKLVASERCNRSTTAF
jgi:hypothetical protein